jgi:hypothetical protein
MKNIIIAALSLIVVVQLVFIIRKPKPQIVQVKGDPYEVQMPVIDTQYIPEIQYVEVKGKDIVHDSIVYVPTAVSADTLAIVASYYMKKVFKDTLRLNGAMGYLLVQDTVAQNKLLGRKVTSKLNMRAFTEVVKEQPKRVVYYGVNAGINKSNVVSHIATGIMIKTKTEKIYQLDIGVANRLTTGTTGTFTPYIGAGVYWKIK